jgi:hypothetical protein
MAFGLLFRRTSNSSPDLNLDKAKWKQFDVVYVYPAAQCPDAPHPDSPHAILVVTDGPGPARARAALCQEYRSGSGLFFGRAKWTFSPPQLPAAIRNALQNTGRAECTFNQFELAVFNRETGLSLRDTEDLRNG